MEAPTYFPFSKLKLPDDEEVLLFAHNPTFHRTSDYGIVVSDRAVYLFSPFWLWFARWRRYPLSDIRRASFNDSRLTPRLVLNTSKRSITFRTPLDTYKDEMDFDRKTLANAAEFVNQLLESPMNTSESS
jgi:hypothetical protein